MSTSGAAGYDAVEIEWTSKQDVHVNDSGLHFEITAATQTAHTVFPQGDCTGLSIMQPQELHCRSLRGTAVGGKKRERESGAAAFMDGGASHRILLAMEWLLPSHGRPDLPFGLLGRPTLIGLQTKQSHCFPSTGVHSLKC